MEGLRVVVDRLPGTLCVRLYGELEMEDADRAYRALTERAAGEDLVIDLRGLTFMGTSGLSLVIDAQRDAAERDYELRLIPGSERIQALFELAGLADDLPWVADAGAHTRLATP